MVNKYRYKIVFSYDGSLFFGYAKQIDKRTIQGEIEKVLSTIFCSNITIYASGRTDKGVHAYAQVADFVLDKKIINIDKTLSSINKLLPGDIYVKELRKVNNNFSARFNAKSKEYEYIINYKNYDPLKRNYELFDNKIINIDNIKSMSKLFIGTHNFKNFTSKEQDEFNFVRTIFDIKIKNYKDGHLKLTFIGDGFMRYEIRKIVGTLIECGKNRLSENEILYYLNNEKRIIINYTAIPNGLYLKKVRYK